MNSDKPDVKCISCALDQTIDRENEWIAPGIYIVNGQSVCEKHIGAPYHFPEHGLGGMHARYNATRFNDALDEDADA